RSGELDAADAVDHAVMRLGDDREAIALEPLDHPHLPERLPAIELLRHQPAGEALEEPLVARARQVRVADVISEIEEGVVDPDGMLEARRPCQALAIAWNAIEAGLH